MRWKKQFVMRIGFDNEKYQRIQSEHIKERISRFDGKLYSGNGISTDIIGASIRAYISAVNKIVYDEQGA